MPRDAGLFQRSGLQLADRSQRIQYKSGRQSPRVAGCGSRESCRAATDPFHNLYSSVATNASWWLKRHCPPLHCQALPAQCQNLIGELRGRWAGTLLSKCVRNAWLSSSWVIARDALSAMLLSAPATCMMLTGAECNIRWQSANPRTRRYAASEFAVLVAILVNQATLGVLLL